MVLWPPPPVSGQLTVGRLTAGQTEGGDHRGPVEEGGEQQDGDQGGGVALEEVKDGLVTALAVEAGPGLLGPAHPCGGGGAAGVRQPVLVTPPPLGVLPVTVVRHSTAPSLQEIFLSIVRLRPLQTTSYHPASQMSHSDKHHQHHINCYH